MGQTGVGLEHGTLTYVYVHYMYGKIMGMNGTACFLVVSACLWRAYELMYGLHSFRIQFEIKCKMTANVWDISPYLYDSIHHLRSFDAIVSSPDP